MLNYNEDLRNMWWGCPFVSPEKSLCLPVRYPPVSVEINLYFPMMVYCFYSLNSAAMHAADLCVLRIGQLVLSGPAFRTISLLLHVCMYV